MRRICLFFSLFLFATITCAESFIKVKNGCFFSGDSLYYFFGTNWECTELFKIESPRQRNKILAGELDLMLRYGIKNLRVSLDLDSTVSSSHSRSGNMSVFTGLDYLIKEAQRRSMRLTLHVTVKKDLGKLHYSKSLLERNLKLLAQHKNVFTHKAYFDDPVIMSWEFSRTLFDVYGDEYLDEFVSYVGNLLPQQLLSITDIIQYEDKSKNASLDAQIYANPHLDYISVEILPREFGWVGEDRIFEDLSNAYVKTNEYLNRLEFLANKYNKPVIIDKFNYPRDRSRRIPLTTTRSRDGFYTYMLDKLVHSSQQHSYIGGTFMYTWGGWHIPIDYRKTNLLFLLQNEKDLNPYNVCSSDSSTLQIIANGIKALQK